MMKQHKHPQTGDIYYSLEHPSGLTIFVWPQPGAAAAYALFATRYGSVYNTLPTPDGGVEEVPEGIAHYLEHKLFESEEGDAFERFAATGANANAYTSFERTAYLFQATENIVPSLEILLDFVQHPYFTPQTVEKEQGIIGQEIRMCEDDPSRCVLFNLLQGMYHRHPVRIDIAGTVASISHITADLLYRCYGQYYNLHNMVLTVAGRITPAQVEEAADKLLKSAPAMLPAAFTCDEPDTVARHRVEQVMPVAAPLFYLGIKEPGAVERDAKALAGAQLLTDLLVGRSTPLYARLMEEGLINEQFAAEYFNGPGFGIWLFAGESRDPERVAQAILEELKRQQAAGLDPEAVEIARRAAYGETVSGLDEASTCAEMLLSDWIDGIAPLSRLEALAGLTVAELNAQLRARMPAEEYTLSVIRPEPAE